MGFPWKPLLPLMAAAFLVIHEEMISAPSCAAVRGGAGEDAAVEDDPEDLKVMVVANLLLLGSDAGYLNTFYRDYYMSKFFKKSFKALKPDMVLVLGDVSAKGYNLTKRKWLSVIWQFRRMLGPFIDLPYHVVLGDRDIGACSGLDKSNVYWIASRFSGLDSAGCSAFEFKNVSFLSLNAVALLCGKNDLRFSVEKVIEKGSLDLQMEATGKTQVITDTSSTLKEVTSEFGWRENFASSGSGPVLLLHFPMHRKTDNLCRKHTETEQTSTASDQNTEMLKSRGLVGLGPYERSSSLPSNETEYILQALKPRIVFSAHTHEFCEYVHFDGTREVTVPAMTWDARDDPGFVVATFRRNRKTVSISHCSLVRESHVLTTLISALVLIILATVVMNPLHLATSRR